MQESNRKDQSVGNRPSRGRPASPEVLRKRTIDIQDDLWEWALGQPEGGARLVRDLLGLERRRRLESEQKRHIEGERQHWVSEPASSGDARELAVTTPGGILVAVEVTDGILLLFEEDLAVQCLYDTQWGRLRIHIPVKIDPLEVRMAQARQRGQTQKDGGGASAEGGTTSPDGPAQAE